MTKQEFYSLKEVAEILNLAEITVRRMVKRGSIKAHTFGRVYRISREDLDEFIRACRELGRSGRS